MRVCVHGVSVSVCACVCVCVCVGGGGGFTGQKKPLHSCVV